MTSGASAVPGETATAWTGVPPVIEMFAGVSASWVASFSIVIASCLPHPSGPRTSR